MWTYDDPIIELPYLIRDYFKDEADFLYSDLSENCLTVVLVPAPDPNFAEHRIRVVETHNPVWYKGLYHQLSHFRRDRSLRSLDRIRNLKDRKFLSSHFKYDSIYRELIKYRLMEGYKTNHYKVPPSEEVIVYFEPESIIVPF